MTTISGDRNGIGRCWAAAIGVLLATTAASASAQQIEVLELGHFNTLEVAILGGPGFEPNAVSRKGLVLAVRQQGKIGGYLPVARLPRGRVDLNGDGYIDRIARFRLSDQAAQALRDGEAGWVELRGIHHDGIFADSFVATAAVLGESEPVTYCSPVYVSDQIVAERCIWTSAADASFKPIDVGDLVDSMNDTASFEDLEVTADSAVVIEAYGGSGYKGATWTNGAKGGDGGGYGYARTIVTVADLGADLYIYPGAGESAYSTGGSSSVVASVDLYNDLTGTQLSSTSAEEVAGFGVFAIAGGGGGAGSGQPSNGNNGGSGGAGGSAIATVSAMAVGAGADGIGHGTPGNGGAGTGGAGQHPGSDGIGGPGGLPNGNEDSHLGSGPFWTGWSTSDGADYSTTIWGTGAGAYNDDNAGGGGGGFGGGGSGFHKGHNGGAGGGGSLAAQATVDDSDGTLDHLIAGGGAGAGQIVVTFELLQVE